MQKLLVNLEYWLFLPSRACFLTYPKRFSYILNKLNLYKSVFKMSQESYILRKFCSEFFHEEVTLLFMFCK